MSDDVLELTLACGDHALTRPLQTEEVSPEGVDLEVLTPFAPDRHWQMLRNLEFDICELSLGSYLASRASSHDYPFTAIPVFPHRSFRHSYMCKHSGSGVSDPGELSGCKVGINTWQTTAGVWMRGIAREEYGLDLESVTWYRRAPEDVPLDLLESFNIRNVPDDSSLDEMLSSGDLKGVFYPILLASVRAGTGGERIFASPFTEEKRYYKRTEIFPLMHTVVIKDEVLRRAPRTAEKVYEAFTKSKNIGLAKLEDSRTSALVWARRYLEEEKALFGGSPWEYGLTRTNQKALDKLQKYALNQEIISTRYDPEELFIQSTL
ncbi:4,5-dihydroxyphthalate decarboxylase [Candidatus Bipolaricaulota bacterium]|nr:4,5-dihydroxyphthalate decarboxylase [Candidatus Bipolaricaulota bacterium]